MSYKVVLRRNADGLTREHVEPDDIWDSGASYIWSEGNYSCDCNRAIFFDLAGGGNGDPERSCGDVEFSVLYVELPDGTRVEIDEAD